MDDESWLALLYPALSAVSVAVVLALRWITYAGRDRLLEEGVAARAVVTVVEHSGVRIDAEAFLRLSLRIDRTARHWRESMKPVDVVHGCTVPSACAPHLRPGSTLTVRHAANDLTQLVVDWGATKIRPASPVFTRKELQSSSKGS